MADLPPADPDRFEEAIAAFRKRVPMTRKEWDDLNEAQREHAFMVSEVATADVVTDVCDAIDKAITEGSTLEDFKENVGDLLESSWGGPRPGRLDTIFRTNVQTAYNAGRHAIFSAPAVKKARPYLRFDGVEDDRQCFAAGTPVRTASGDVPIESIKPGQFVISCRGRQRRVLAVFVSQQVDWVRITLSTGVTVTATPDHPFLAAGGWIGAGKLRPGDRVVVASDSDGMGALPGLWEEVSSVLPETLLRPRVPRIAVQAEAATVRRLPRALHAAGRARRRALLLLRGVCASEIHLRLVREGVHDPVRPREAGHPSNMLFDGVQGGAAARRIPQRPAAGEMRPVRPGLRDETQQRASRDHQQALLDTVSHLSRDAHVRELWRRVRAQADGQGDGSVLFRRLLSEEPRGDVARGGGAAAARGGGDPVSPGGTDRAVVSRFPGVEPGGDRGGRRVLARGPENEGARQAPRSGDGQAGIRRPEVRRGGGQGRPVDGYAQFAGLAPRPRRGLPANAEVLSVELSSGEATAYDLQVDDDRGYLAAGCVVHNSDICEACNNVVLPADDPFWGSHTPPLHYNCRSTVVALSVDEADDEGVTGEPPADDADEGFGAPPSKEGADWEPDLDGYPKEIGDELKDRLR